jgi:hypothetical protein
MPEISPDRRRDAVEAIAGYLAARRIRESGGDWDEVLAECIAEVDADPQTDADIALAAAAPPPGDWEPETRFEVRQLLRRLLREDRP